MAIDSIEQMGMIEQCSIKYHRHKIVPFFDFTIAQLMTKIVMDDYEGRSPCPIYPVGAMNKDMCKSDLGGILCLNRRELRLCFSYQNVPKIGLKQMKVKYTKMRRQLIAIRKTLTTLLAVR